ncbi:tetratricopeptide repeat protein [Saccharothrix obliqua]|uniref:tetratricopeptide repeat protein n=1 Tax=Saccharothrix obliqua TaxID=2861747 RepID=UPI001C5EA8AF|nr:hypothetical protein [Saccharothrix obliqua]MBW4719157.1 hypothetical protein [Saccharothrix obliqua]
MCRETGLAALLAAATAGDADAMVSLGLLLGEGLTGDEGEEGLRSEVGRWLGRAAAAGHVRGTAEYGSFLWHVEKDEEAALPWLQRAAEAGEVDAMALLGDVHDFLGYLDEAKRWYRMAAERGDAHAAGNLAALDHLTG